MIDLKASAADRAAAEKVLAALETQPGYDARKALVFALAALIAANKAQKAQKPAVRRGDTVRLRDGTIVKVEKNGRFLAVFMNGNRVYSVDAPA